MNRSIHSFALALTLGASACSAPDGGTHSAHDARDEPSAAPSGSSASREKQTGTLPIADRMRSLDKAVYKVEVDDLPTIGSANAPLTVVLFSDYECPFCNKVEPQIAQLRADHGSDVRVVLAPKPLPFHKQAKPAALAAIAAAEQGKLEPMHRALVALDGKIDEAALTSAARSAGLDLARFDADRRGAKAEKTLAKAEEIAKRFSVEGTPTTFINGRRITGAVPDVIHQLGEEQLAAGRALLHGGTPPARVYETIIANGLEGAGPDPNVRVHLRLSGERMAELKKCWAAPNAKAPTSVEMTVGANGKVARISTDQPALATCVTKTASAWTFPASDDETWMKLVFDKDE